MTPEEYNIKKVDLEKEHRCKIAALNKEFAVSNSTVKKGDIITDRIGSIIVEKIDGLYYDADNYPKLIFSGVQCTKKGVPYKRGTKRQVFQGNLDGNQSARGVITDKLTGQVD